MSKRKRNPAATGEGNIKQAALDWRTACAEFVKAPGCVTAINKQFTGRVHREIVREAIRLCTLAINPPLQKEITT